MTYTKLLTYIKLQQHSALPQINIFLELLYQYHWKETRRDVRFYNRYTQVFLLRKMKSRSSALILLISLDLQIFAYFIFMSHHLRLPPFYIIEMSINFFLSFFL